MAKVARPPACAKKISKVQNRGVAKSSFVHLLMLIILILSLTRFVTGLFHDNSVLIVNTIVGPTQITALIQ